MSVKYPRIFFFLVALLGVLTRLAAMVIGHNYDFTSYLIVARLARVGANIYSSTNRYNYGPVWFNILHVFDSIASSIALYHALVFRVLIVILLSLADIGIAAVLWRKVNLTAATIFILNPISIFISGYHNQFDNIAILIGLVAVLIIGDHIDRVWSRRVMIGLCFIGLSLVVKHVLFMFPVWLALKQKSWRDRAVIVFVPSFIFLLSFVPYLFDGWLGILKNVFLYDSWENRVFYHLFVPDIVQLFLPSTTLWLTVLLVTPLLVQDLPNFDLLLFYLMLMTMTSPALTNQYLIIPLAFLVTRMNVFGFLYTALGLCYLAIEMAGSSLGIDSINSFILIYRNDFYAAFVILLLCNLLWVVRHHIVPVFTRIVGRERAFWLVRSLFGPEG